jgi:hypothetical protein
MLNTRSLSKEKPIYLVIQRKQSTELVTKDLFKEIKY